MRFVAHKNCDNMELIAMVLYVLCQSLSRESSLSLTPSSTPASSGQIPKYGTLIANRIFVGGLPADVCSHVVSKVIVYAI